MMAVGKTTVSRRLAADLGRAVWDSDEMIERRTGHTVAELWEASGEAAYRLLETEVLEEALAAVPPGVVAAAGGVVLSAANRELLRSASARGAVVVWLRVDPSVLAGRVQIGDHRPLLKEDPAGTLHHLLDERAALYAEVADRSLDVGGRTVESVVAAVRDELVSVIAERTGQRA
jgi:shikimate kinase